MPGPLISGPAVVADVAPSLGWYGKSPSTGDFISRRLAKAAVDKLDSWLQAGMTVLREQSPDDWDHHYAAAPVWNALLPARIVSGSACLAVIAPSFDRVGRRFPLCVIVTLSGGAATLARITSVPEYCASLGGFVAHAIRTSIGTDEFDRQLSTLTSRYFRDESSEFSDLSDITAVLGSAAVADDLATMPLTAHAAFPWPDLVHAFEPAGLTSYWWSSAQPGRLNGGFTHSGSLDATLFVTLFGGAGTVAEGRVAPG
jgi:type VI secretion system protein ImpM